MLGTLINTGLIITMFAIAMPFIFVLLVIKITTSSNNNHRKHRSSEHENSDDLNEIAKVIEGFKPENRQP